MSLFFILLIVLLVLLIPTAYAGYIGAPWAPVKKRALDRVFKEIGVGEGEVVVDLGSGDGKVLIAADRCGARGVGYELSPIMYAVSWVRTFGKRITVKFRNFFRQTLPPETTVIYSFLLPENMPRLEQYLKRQPLPNLKYVVIYIFPFRSLTPAHTVREKHCGPVYVYDAASFR